MPRVTAKPSAVCFSLVPETNTPPASARTSFSGIDDGDGLDLDHEIGSGETGKMSLYGKGSCDKVQAPLRGERVIGLTHRLRSWTTLMVRGPAMHLLRSAR